MFSPQRVSFKRNVKYVKYIKIKCKIFCRLGASNYKIKEDKISEFYFNLLIGEEDLQYVNSSQYCQELVESLFPHVDREEGHDGGEVRQETWRESFRLK